MLKILAGPWGGWWEGLGDGSGRTAGQDHGLVEGEEAEKARRQLSHTWALERA